MALRDDEGLCLFLSLLFKVRFRRVRCLHWEVAFRLSIVLAFRVASYKRYELFLETQTGSLDDLQLRLLAAISML